MGPVETANKLNLDTYISRFLPRCREGTDLGEPSNWRIKVESAKSMQAGVMKICLDLIETTSKADYLESSSGWQPRKKLKEMKLPDLRYLLAWAPSTDSLVAFASFMMTYEDGHEVVYVYEIHIAEEYRGQGLGSKLMALIEDAGNNAGMEKAMLTVFVSNQAASSFYKNLGYSLDEYSPEPRRLRNGIIKQPDYQILSKKL